MILKLMINISKKNDFKNRKNNNNKSKYINNNHLKDLIWFIFCKDYNKLYNIDNKLKTIIRWKPNKYKLW